MCSKDERRVARLTQGRAWQRYWTQMLRTKTIATPFAETRRACHPGSCCFAQWAGLILGGSVHYCARDLEKDVVFWKRLSEKHFFDTILPPVHLVSFDFRAHHETRRCELLLTHSFSPGERAGVRADSFWNFNCRLPSH